MSTATLTKVAKTAAVAMTAEQIAAAKQFGDVAWLNIYVNCDKARKIANHDMIVNIYASEAEALQRSDQGIPGYSGSRAVPHIAATAEVLRIIRSNPKQFRNMATITPTRPAAWPVATAFVRLTDALLSHLQVPARETAR